jgi:hypothetical protein
VVHPQPRRIARVVALFASVGLLLAIFWCVVILTGMSDRPLAPVPVRGVEAQSLSEASTSARSSGGTHPTGTWTTPSRELHTELGDRFALAVIASDLGHLAFDAGDVDRAITLYAEALQHFDSVGNPEGLVEAIEWLAVTATANGDGVPALRLFGAAAAVREALQLPPRFESDEQRVASGLDQATRAAGTDAVVVLAEGRTLSLEEARDEALELAGTLSADAW